MNKKRSTDESGEENDELLEIESASSKPLEASPPEVPPKMENLAEWDTPPDSSGGPVPKVLPEDESSGAEELVEEGVEEADREQRIAASDSDFED